MPTRRAIRKRLRRKFKPGDVVTWGRGVIAHRVVDVLPAGLLVDSTSSEIGRAAGERLLIFLEFAPASRSHRCPGPPRHSKLAPDRIGDPSDSMSPRTARCIWHRVVTFGHTDRTVAGGAAFVEAARMQESVAWAALDLLEARR